MDERGAMELLENWTLSCKTQKGQQALRIAIKALREKVEQKKRAEMEKGAGT